MKHTLQISVSKKPKNDGIAAVRKVSVREKFLRFLFGDKTRLTVIVPGDTVQELEIREIGKDLLLPQDLPCGCVGCGKGCSLAQAQQTPRLFPYSGAGSRKDRGQEAHQRRNEGTRLRRGRGLLLLTQIRRIFNDVKHHQRERNTVDSLTTIRKLKENGTECYFEKENIWTFDGKGELLLTIMSSLAQEESRSISENCTWGQRKRFQDGNTM